MRDSVPANSSIESQENVDWDEQLKSNYPPTIPLYIGWLIRTPQCKLMYENQGNKKLACAGDRGEERPEKNWKLQPVCFHLSQQHPEWPSRPLVFCISMPHFLRASRQRLWIPTILFPLHSHAQWEREREEGDNLWWLEDGVTPFYFSSFWNKLWVCGCIWTCTLPHPH